MDQFLERYNLPTLTWEEKVYVNRPVTITEIETVIRYLPTGLPGGPVVKNPPDNARNLSLMPGRGVFHMTQGN